MASALEDAEKTLREARSFTRGMRLEAMVQKSERTIVKLEEQLELEEIRLSAYRRELNACRVAEAVERKKAG